MRIGYDITPIGQQASGVGTYALHLLTSMAELDEGHEFFMLSNRSGHQGRLPAHRELYDAWQPFPSRMIWMQCMLPQRLQLMGTELCHYPNSIAPLRSPCPYVLTIHDMTLSMLPQHHPWRKQIIIRPLIPLLARRAAKVITVSSSARDDIVRLLGLPPERIAVIPEAAGAQFRPASKTEQQRVGEKYGIARPYVLYIGTLEPRKNLVRLIKAWAELRRTGVINQQLVIVGAAGWQYEPIYRAAQESGCPEEIIFTGYVPGEDLPGLYSGADLFAFPSLYEGFGLPVIEAMACGAPVLISTTPALLEVAGQAALAVEADSIAAIKGGLERLLCDERLREQLRVAGFKRAADFSWQRTAQCTLAVYHEALKR
jgi:glycosyltransferase involved in cell wall biosynthesis